MTMPKEKIEMLIISWEEAQAACISSAERGVLDPVEICMSATDVFKLPPFIFLRSRAKP